MWTGFDLSPVTFENIDGWERDNVFPAFKAFCRSAQYALTEKPYRVGEIGLSNADFREPFESALKLLGSAGRTASHAFFEQHFQPFEIVPDHSKFGHVTGFYEPVIAASRKRSAKYQHPFYGVPANLVEIDDANRPAGMDPEIRFGKIEGDQISLYPDRKEIETGYLDNLNLEIAFVENPVDVFFAHIQGAARLQFQSGDETRITFAGKSGHRFTGIGRLLVERGEIPKTQVSMKTIREWLAVDAMRARHLMWENQSFIFFREVDIGELELGQVAAAKVPLEPGRSMAVDRLIHTFGSPIYVHAENLIYRESPFSRLMIAQDTGSAIQGAARGDLFTGSGDLAGDLAGGINHEARFFLFVPKFCAGRYR